ncbi:MAG: carboxyl transferase domain-containing protein [Lachnospiraceae bacterium]|nr:carboxyl transferase domain-containing protein [Lachnospiraceae bacterium]MEE3461392.1 carboxyl transferase domain-containing protein [Lachnospiraceae bacterium]
MSNSKQKSARERIAALTDENSFVEIGALVTGRNTDFNMGEKKAPGDGVVTGYALIHDNPVYIYSQDASALGGSIGEMHAKKIVELINLAVKTGTPVVGLIDCAGLRVQESTDALASFGMIYKAMADASGVVPQITAVLGKCGGGAALLAAMSDFTFIEKNNGRLFVNSPNALENNYKEKLDTSASDFNAASGSADFVYDGEDELFENLRDLVSVLPSNNNETGGTDESMDDLNRETPAFANEIKDPALALEDLGDNNFFLEVSKDNAKEMVTGLLCLDGITVGAVANRTALFDENGKEAEKFDSVLTTAGCMKAASFVKKCNAFNIPILTLTSVTGFASTVEEEKTVGKAAAALTAAFASSDVPKVNLITGASYGSASLVMNSKSVGADMVFALPTARFGVMDAELAAKIMNDGTDQDKIKADALSFAAATDINAAAARGYVDSIVEPAQVRKNLLYAVEMLFSKSEFPVSRKNSTI